MDGYTHRRRHRAEVRHMRQASNAGPRGTRTPHQNTNCRRAERNGIKAFRIGIPTRGRLFAAALLVLPAAAVVRLSWPSGTVRAQDPAVHSAPANSTTTAAPAARNLPIVIHVDATTTAAESKDDVATVCKLAPASGELRPVWDDWTSFKGKRVRAESNSDTTPVYAARIENGFAACVTNLADQKAAFKVAVNLPTGVYEIDRLVFGASSQGIPARTERLVGIVLAKQSQIWKSGGLAAGDAAIYRFRNLTAGAASSYVSVKSRLASLRQARPSEYRRIMIPLRECWDNLAEVTTGVRPETRYECLKNVHRAMLTLAHAQSLCRNYCGEGRIAEALGTALQSDLDRLQSSLAGLSAVCLVLVPNVEVAQTDPADPLVRKITVTVANQGEREVSLVRIGAVGPKGASIFPGEEAMFPSLKPGETVRASFSIRLTEDADGRGLAAQIGYFTARSPAHLRIPVT